MFLKSWVHSRSQKVRRAWIRHIDHVNVNLFLKLHTHYGQIFLKQNISPRPHSCGHNAKHKTWPYGEVFRIVRLSSLIECVGLLLMEGQ